MYIVYRWKTLENFYLADSDLIADTEVSTSSPVEPDHSSQEVVLDKSRSQSSSPTNESR